MTDQNGCSYLTTPLYYVNARPHLGHSYTTILGDVMKKHRQMRGEKVIYLTGTDEHGEKIQQIAQDQKRDVKEFVDEVAAEFKKTWQAMDIGYDIFYRTTDPDHIQKVQHALQLLKDKGEIVFREYEGNYCVGCERFLTDTELNPLGQCPDHLKKPELRKEANYFFLMSKYRNGLIEYFEQHPNAIRPEHYRNEMLSFLKQPLGDLCISRPKERLTWGIELPFDSRFVTYVWFDALLNYLNATGWPSKDFNAQQWGSVNHLIAKDILKAHSIYWNAMLMALGLAPVNEIHVSGYWLIDGTKMSKSLGNVIRPLEVEALYGRDTLRFYLLREMSYGLDSTFTLESYIKCINAYLANGIGNFVSRVYTIAKKNIADSHGGVLKFDAAALNEADLKLLGLRKSTLAAWDEAFDSLRYQQGLKAWCDLVASCDLYVNEMKPWALAKDPGSLERLKVVMGVCLRMIESLGALIYPVLPHAAVEIFKTLGISSGDPAFKFGVEHVLEDRSEFKLTLDTPKLFMRVQLPAVEA